MQKCKMKWIKTGMKRWTKPMLSLVLLPSITPALALAADTSQQKLYVLNSELNTMTVVDVASNQILGTVEVGLEPHGLASPKSQDVLWVSAEGAHQLVKVDPMADRVIARYPVGRRPNEIDVTSDGRLVFIPSPMDGVYEVFDTGKEMIVATIPTDGIPHNVVVSPDDSLAYLAPMDRGNYFTEEQARRIGLPTAPNQKLYVLDVASLSVAAKIPLPDAPRPIAIHPRGHRIYVNRDELLGFEVVDTAGRKRISTAHYEMTREERATPSRSHGIGITPDGREVWSTDINNGVVHVFDATQDEPRHLARLETGRTPLWLTITPDGKTVYVSNTADNTVSAFDVASKKEVTRIKFPEGTGPKRILVVNVPTT